MNILDRIVQSKKEEIARRRSEISLADLLNHASAMPPAISFREAIDQPEIVSVIAEIKRASPSAGRIREDFDLEAIARCYADHGASAISVLTDEPFFAGRLEYLSQVRSYVNLPLLRKDFFIDPYQVVEAKAHGASCVLLILALLTKSQCHELLAAAREVRLETLVEVHTAEELNTALDLDAALIGMNNRDLKTFSVDLSTTERLIDSISSEVTLISESGIKHRADVQRLGNIGVDAVLVGETLMRQSNIGSALRQLTGVRKWSR